MDWKDTTGYRQGDKKRIPKTYTAKGRNLSVTVHIYMEQWELTCHELNISKKPLKADSKEGAQKEALEWLETVIKAYTNDMTDISIHNS
tara:strand:+ start:353 stop:619 length:267 start_codon:yes stop_codon:yes gene_type:complete